MAVMLDRALLETQDAFDAVASKYDQSNTENLLLCEMRRRVLDTFRRHVPSGAHILDLGCGPGSDAEALGRAGYRVTAIDWSPAMVEQARLRIHRAGMDDSVDVHHLGIHELDRLAPVEFAAAYSNFGPLNCVPDLGEAARHIAMRLRPTGIAVASVMGRICPWELALYLCRGNVARLRVRFARGLVPVPLNGRTVWTRYYTPGEFGRTLTARGFRRLSLQSLGLFVPPPYLNRFAERHKTAIAALRRIDDSVGTWPILREWGDHFLMVLRKL